MRDPTFGHGTVKEIDYETDYGDAENRAYNYYFVVFDEEGEGHPRCIAGPFGPTCANYYHVVFDEGRPQRTGAPRTLSGSRRARSTRRHHEEARDED